MFTTLNYVGLQKSLLKGKIGRNSLQVHLLIFVMETVLLYSTTRLPTYYVYVAQDGLKPTVIFSLLSAGTTGMYHHIQLHLSICFYIRGWEVPGARYEDSLQILLMSSTL